MQNIIRLAQVYQWQNEFAKAKVLFDQARSMINGNSMSATLVADYHLHFRKYYFDQGLYGLASCEFELAFELAFELRNENSSSADPLAASQLALRESKNKWSIIRSDNIIFRRAISSDAEAIHSAHMASINWFV